jgi:PAS domain S-box-containing protein
MIRYFNDNPKDTIWTGDVKMGDREFLAMFSAMRMEKSCLRCHGKPADAPYGLVKRYGPDASFYLPLGEVVGLDTIAIPGDAVKEMMRKKNIENIGVIGILISLLSASLVFAFKFVITDRLGKITRHLSDSQRQGEDLKIESIEVRGRDEIAVLTESFNNLAERLNYTYAKLTTEIEERKQAQNALRESEEKYRKLFDLESDALALIDSETGKILDINRAFIKLYGYGKEEILFMKNTDFSAEPDETRKATQDRLEYIPLRYHKKKNGAVFPVEITANTFEHQGKNVHIAAIRDIADRKIVEQQIEASLRDKEVLLSEIHHRVKNNFEIISSLLDMAGMRIENREIQNLLISSRTRIHSMAMIHSQLYQNDRFDSIDMVRHTAELAVNLQFIYGSEKKIDLSIEPAEVYLSLRQAIPCALILNELITNSLKYAFNDKKQGKIRISICRSGDDTVLIRVKDDGCGILEEASVKPAGGLGLELVKHLVIGQLKGEMRFDNDNGTDIHIEFKT